MLIPLHVLPMFGFAAITFLMFGVILAAAVWIAFRSGQAGSTKLGGFAGCMVAFALVFVAGLGAFACFLVAVINAPSELVRHGPVRKIEAHWPDGQGKSSDGKDPKAAGGDEKESDSDSDEPKADEHESHGLHIRVEVAGVDGAQIARWFREHTQGDLEVSTHRIDGPDGKRTRIDVRIPVSDAEVRELRNDLQQDLPNLNLPEGVSIELKGEDED